jgi:ADP-ribosylglycohydrolase
MTLSWIGPADLVEHELQELEETGFAVDDERRRWASAIDPGQRGAMAEGLLLDLSERTRASLSTADEPTGLEEILAATGQATGALSAPVPLDSVLADRIRAGWFGRAAGCLLGKPVEKTRREGIREILMSNASWPLSDYVTERGVPEGLLRKYPWNKHSGRESLRENIVCMAEDDDLNYTMLNLFVLESAGRDFTTGHVAEAWLSLMPVLSTFTAERVAYRNLLEGIAPPATASHRNPYREWIGAQIRADVFGWISPGKPEDAARHAYRDASLTHVRNGIYGEMFVAAMVAAACATNDPAEVIRAGLGVIPPGSRLAQAVRFAMGLKESTWEGAVDRLYERFGRYHWVHSVNNAAIVTAALVYGNGDYGRSICNVVMGGWDTDSNGATVGSVAGTMLGKVPDQWTAPLNDTVSSSLKGFDRSSIGQLAERTNRIAIMPR